MKCLVNNELNKIRDGTVLCKITYDGRHIT